MSPKTKHRRVPISRERTFWAVLKPDGTFLNRPYRGPALFLNSDDPAKWVEESGTKAKVVEVVLRVPGANRIEVPDDRGAHDEA